MKVRSLLVLLLCVILALASSCVPHQAAPRTAAPSVTPFASPSPTPLPTLSPSPSPSPTPEPYTVADFMPLENIFLSYVEPSTNRTFDSYVEFIINNEKKPILQRRTVSASGPLYVEVFCCIDGEYRLEYKQSNVGYTFDFTGKTNEASQVLLKEPIVVNNSWPVKDGISTITSIDYELSIPLGTFKAVEVTTQYDTGSTQKRYFLAGLGLVAEYHSDANGTIDSYYEASVRETDKAFVQNIRFFYADQTDNSIKYKMVQIPLTPDISARSVFKEYLSTKRPSGSTLIPMSSSVNIRSIKLGKNTVTVDFSQELVTQMQLSHKNERTFLQALANTFGEYYQKDNVVLTIEGQTYQSRFITLLDGDSFRVNISQASRYDG